MQCVQDNIDSLVAYTDTLDARARSITSSICLLDVKNTQLKILEQVEKLSYDISNVSQDCKEYATLAKKCYGKHQMGVYFYNVARAAKFAAFLLDQLEELSLEVIVDSSQKCIDKPSFPA